MPKLLRLFCLLTVLLVLPLPVLAAGEADECSHTYAGWAQLDGESHTAACTLCGKTVTAAHAYEEFWSTTASEHTHKCGLCGYTAEGQAHSWPDAWEGDALSHIRLCTVCQVAGQSREHSWDAGKTLRMAGLFRSGKRQYTCTVCSYVRTDSLPAHKALGIVLVSVLGTAALAAAVFFILRAIKKKRVG